jgi:hypothetical protein
MGAQGILYVVKSVAAVNGQTVNVILDTLDVANLSIQVVTTGTPTGTFAWKRANAPDCDEKALGATSSNWVTYAPSGAPANPAGAGANTVFEITPFATRYLLFTYTDGGGGSAGTLLFAAYGKGQG